MHQMILQSRSNQNSIVFAQNQKYGSMEENTEPRNNPTHLWTQERIYNGEKMCLQQMVTGNWKPHVNQWN